MARHLFTACVLVVLALSTTRVEALATNECRTGRGSNWTCCLCPWFDCNRRIFAESDFNDFAEALDSTDWIEVVNSEPELVLWKEPAPSLVPTTIRAKVRFAVDIADVDTVVDLLTDVSQRRKWDTVTAATEIVRSCAPDRHRIMYSVMKIASVALDRDFLYALSGPKTTNECTIILQKDVGCPPHHDCYPADPAGAVVRGKVGRSGMRVCPTSLDNGVARSFVELLLDYDVGATDASPDAVSTAAQLTLTNWYRNLVNHVNGRGGASTDSSVKTPYPFHKHFVRELIRDEFNCDPDASWRTIMNGSAPTGTSVCMRHWVGTNTFAFKSFHVVDDVTPCDVARILTSYSTRSSWDRTFPKIDVVEKHRHYHVLYWVLGLPPPFVNRDVVLYMTVRRLDDGGYVILYRNADSECRRPVPGLVRAVAYPSAVFIHPTPPKETKKGSVVSYYLHMDIGPGVQERDFASMLRGRAYWTSALLSHYKKIGGGNSPIETSFDFTSIGGCN